MICQAVSNKFRPYMICQAARNKLHPTFRPYVRPYMICQAARNKFRPYMICHAARNKFRPSCLPYVRQDTICQAAGNKFHVNTKPALSIHIAQGCIFNQFNHQNTQKLDFWTLEERLRDTFFMNLNIRWPKHLMFECCKGDLRFWSTSLVARRQDYCSSCFVKFSI